MSSQSENSLFRWFVMGWMSIAGVMVFLYMAMSFLGIDGDDIGNFLGFAPLLLLGLLIYSYVKGRDILLKRLCMIYVFIGVPFILLMFVMPMFMWQ